MSKIKEALRTLALATRYSFAFCWRNSKKETLIRIGLAIIGTVSTYLGIQALGFMINEAQRMIKGYAGKDVAVVEVAKNDLVYLSVFMVCIMLFDVVRNGLNWLYRSRWFQKLRFANTREILEHKASLDVARFNSKEFDDLQQRIAELPNSWQTRIWFSNEILTLFTTTVSFIIFGASLLWYKPIYAVILMLTGLPMMVTTFLYISMVWNMSQELVPQHKQRHVLESPYSRRHAFVQVLMFNQAKPLRQEIDANVDCVIKANDRVRRIGFRHEMITHSLATIGLCGVVIHAIWSTVTNAGDIGILTVIIAASKTFQGNLEAIMTAIAEQWNSARGVILIEKDFFGLKPMVKTENPIMPAFTSIPCIRFERVSFTYPNTDTMVLRDVSFTIEPGSKVAIVGKSGNGKSTIQALIMRHYDPTSGDIYVDDINLRQIEPCTWNDTISALTQDYSILPRRVKEEIASSRMDRPINPDLVRESSILAHFDEVIASDPQGYDTQIGTEFGGREFSGGEKQRLALARVFYRETPIIVLDEPDAKLDPESAQKVIDHVFSLKGVTVIMITHHVSRAQRCDKVIVMKKGEIAEQGTPSELMARNGIYTSMFRKDVERLGKKSDEDSEDSMDS